MKKLKYLLFIFCVTACGGGDDEMIIDDEPVASAATAVTALDVANFADIRDIQISFNPPDDITAVSSYIAFVVKSSEVEQVNIDQVLAAPITSYTSFLSTAKGDPFRMDESKTDINGNPIVEGAGYQVMVLTIARSGDAADNVLSEPSEEIILEQKSAVYTLASIKSAGSGGMDIDAQGNVYMADFGGSLSGNPWGTRVHKINASGNVSVFASNLLGASGNDFDSEGNLFQSSIARGTITKITPSGISSSFATGLQGPVGIAVRDDGSMLVCNCGNNTIGLVSATGSVSTYASSNLFNCPNGIDIDEAGNAYVANFSNGSILKITTQGVVSNFATIPGSNNGHLLINGNFIYVVARGANQIYRVSFGGAVSHLAGTGSRGLQNGPLSQVTFSLPNDIAFSEDGKKIYVNDVASFSANQAIIAPVAVRVIDLVD